MKRFIAAIISTVVLGACTIALPQSGDELRSSGGILVTGSNSYQVSRSAASVAQSWRAGASKCLNKTTRSSMASGGGNFGMPINTLYISEYTATVQSNGKGGYELTLRMISHGAKIAMGELDTGSIIYAATVSPTANGSRVDDVWLMMYFGELALSTGVRAWAEGTSSACPEMPR